MQQRTKRDPRDLLYVVIGIAILVLSALPVDGNKAPDPEPAFFHFFNSWPELFYWPLWIVMQLGNLLVVPAAAVVAAGFRRFKLALAILAAGVAKLYLAQVVKDNVVRERPAAVIDDVTRRGDASAAGQAFVSGHAIIAFALAALISRYVSRRWQLVAWGLAVGVCVGRIYVGAHLPLDAVGGAGLGWAVGSALNFILATPPETREEGIAQASPVEA